jgi:hypothetical protein
MIEIFRTNVTKKSVSKRVKSKLLEVIPTAAINFDLQDCDRILRVQNEEQNFDAQQVIELVGTMGFDCEVLKD